MKIIEASYKILTPIKELKRQIKQIERIARVCYKSEKNIKNDSSDIFIKTLIKNKHLAMLEHSSLSVLFVVDRGISHELVRHRLASFAQESTRYCNYLNEEKFGGELTFIKSIFFYEYSNGYKYWKNSMQYAEDAYLNMIKCGVPPQFARSVLPNSLKTEIVITTNFREWMHIFDLRCDKSAHPEMRDIMCRLRKELEMILPVIFKII